MCLTCCILEGKHIPPGGVLYRDSLVVLHHCCDVKLPGYLILSPVRHVEGYHKLTDAEVTAMARVSRRAMALVMQHSGDLAEKVYLVSFCEETLHFHWHLFPRYSGLPAQLGEVAHQNGQVDGPEIFRWVRREWKVTLPEMETPEIQEINEYIRRGMVDKTSTAIS
ncbi:MAG TPA: HIT domain-containing protein [Patescibacteria group bacterium]|nr:HIT domain-containing protein [Patescibacteria group bacterium]